MHAASISERRTPIATPLQPRPLAGGRVWLPSWLLPTYPTTTNWLGLWSEDPHFQYNLRFPQSGPCPCCPRAQLPTPKPPCTANRECSTSLTSVPTSTTNPESTLIRSQLSGQSSITNKSKRLSTFRGKNRSLTTMPSSTRRHTCPRPSPRRRFSTSLWKLSLKGSSTIQSKSKYPSNPRQVVHYPEETVDLGRRRPVGGQVPQGLTRTSSMGSVIPRPSSHYAGISSTIPTTTVTVNAPGEIVTTTVN